MGVSGKKRSIPMLLAAVAACLIAALLGLQGCGKDQSQQDFVDGMLSIIEENQSQTEIAEKGQAAFMAYYESGFTDLENAAAAAESFTLSNQKDAQSLKELQALEKPDQEARDIADTLRSGVETMDRGNSAYAAELEKAPNQSVEERSMVFAAAAEAMNLYLEGITDIVAACEMLREYAEENGLEGAEDIKAWMDKFTEEKNSLEQSMQ